MVNSHFCLTRLVCVLHVIQYPHGFLRRPLWGQTSLSSHRRPSLTHSSSPLSPKSIISHTFAGNFHEFMGTHAGTSGLSGTLFPLQMSSVLKLYYNWLPKIDIFSDMHPCMKPITCMPGGDGWNCSEHFPPMLHGTRIGPDVSVRVLPSSTNRMFSPHW